MGEYRDSVDGQLVRIMTELIYDPLTFVNFLYPWGKGELVGEDGPDDWQADVLGYLGKATKRQGRVGGAVQCAVKSGHGIGKTALISWVIQWFMSTRPNPQVVVTANTNNQLKNKTWRELSKWHSMSVNKHWFKWSAERFQYVLEAEKSGHWFAAAEPWSKERSDAFQGTHDEHVLVIFDEASLIDDIIWEVVEGAMTTPGAVWLVFGNPTRNSGRFRECFKGGRFSHRWEQFTVDARTAKKSDKTKAIEWLEDYGDDSDFVRVRVKGEFPRAGDMQFISKEDVDEAMGKHILADTYFHSPRVLGVDIARFGMDASVIVRRQGLAMLKVRKFRGKDTMEMAGLVMQEINDWHPDAVFVDEGGVGAGVVDRLNQLGYRVYGVQFGKKATDPKYANKRAEMWGLMKDWLSGGKCSLVQDMDLQKQLVSVQYGFDRKDRILLEKKEDLRRRGEDSPDVPDALALTWAEPVLRSQDMAMLPNASHMSVTEYDVLNYHVGGGVLV